MAPMGFKTTAGKADIMILVFRSINMTVPIVLENIQVLVIKSEIPLRERERALLFY